MYTMEGDTLHVHQLKMSWKVIWRRECEPWQSGSTDRKYFSPQIFSSGWTSEPLTAAWTSSRKTPGSSTASWAWTPATCRTTPSGSGTGPWCSATGRSAAGGTTGRWRWRSPKSSAWAWPRRWCPGRTAWAPTAPPGCSATLSANGSPWPATRSFLWPWWGSRTASASSSTTTRAFWRWWTSKKLPSSTPWGPSSKGCSALRLDFGTGSCSHTLVWRSLKASSEAGWTVMVVISEMNYDGHTPSGIYNKKSNINVGTIHCSNTSDGCFVFCLWSSWFLNHDSECRAKTLCVPFILRQKLFSRFSVYLMHYLWDLTDQGKPPGCFSKSNVRCLYVGLHCPWTTHTVTTLKNQYRPFNLMFILYIV